MTDNKLAGVSRRTRRRIFYGWVIVAASFPVATISYGDLYTFGVFLLPLRETFGASAAAVSGAYSMSIFLYMACGIPFGWLADKYGPRITTIMGSLLMASGFLLTSRVTEVWQLYLTYALVGMGMSTSYSPLFTTVSRWFSRRRGLALGIFSAGVGIGPIIMAPLASRLVTAYDWRVGYLVLAGTMLLTIPVSFLLKKSPEEIGEVPDGMGPAAAAADAPVPRKMEGLSWKQAVLTRPFWFLAIVYFTIGTSLQMVMAHIVAFGRGLGAEPLTAAAVLSTIGGLSVVGRLVMGPVADVFGRRQALAICMFGEGVLVLSLTQVSWVWMLFAFAIIFGFFYGGHVPQMPALVGDTMGLAHMGIVLGSASFFWGIGGAIGPLLAGYVIDVTGSYASAFLIGGCGLLLGGASALMIKRP